MDEIQKTFIKDTIRQLKSGLECYVFDIKTARDIQKLYKEQTGLMFNIKVIDKDYILLKPIKKIVNYIHY